MLRSAAAAILVVATTGSRPALAQRTSTFVALLGRDTVAVESYIRRPNRIEGRQVVRVPRTQIFDYRAFLRADGTLERWEQTNRTPKGEVVGETALDFRGDSAFTAFRTGNRYGSRRVAAPRGSVPWLIYSAAVYEPAIAHARRSGRRLFTAGMVRLVDAPYPLEIRISGDSVEITNVAGENRALIDAQGGITAFDASSSTEHFRLEPAAALDLGALAVRFASRDEQGQGLGSLTPLDSVQGRFGEAQLMVRYSRPSKRGRAIFGALQPWDQVWRTGANNATSFSTTRDLVIAGVEVPAGSYTLYSIPSATRWQLIINRQTGQFGTEYHAEQDLARVPMTREPTPNPVEQFTISLEPSNPSGGRLVLTWDDTRVWVPILVK